MDVAHRRLLERATKLGTHFNRHLLTLEKNLPEFLDTLARHRRLERLDLWLPVSNPRAGMKLIRKVAKDQDQRLRFGRTYYAVQFLLLELAHIDTLRLAIASGQKPSGSFLKFIVGLGNAFVRLSRAYLEFLIEHFVPSSRDFAWALIGVGTLRDQDDIDVALIDDGAEASGRFNLEMARVAHEMLRSATPLHFYLAERMSSAAYTHPLHQYIELADLELHDHVLMSEMANSTLLLGDHRLFEKFKRQVVDRYIRGRRSDNRYHELFVRGLAGEVRSLLMGQLSEERIHLKDDALRIIKGLTHIYWSIHGFQTADPWETLRELAGALGHLKQSFEGLRRSLAFLEAMRAIYQIYHAQDEEIVVASSTRPLDQVAEAMGYASRGVLQPHVQLLVEYYDEVLRSRSLAQDLVEDVRKYLQRNSSIHRLIRMEEGEVEPNLARGFVDRILQFPGNRYWFDVLTSLQEPDSPFLAKLVRDYYFLEPKERESVVSGLLVWARENLFAWMHFIRLLGGAGIPEARQLRLDLNLAFLEQGGTRDFRTRLAERFILVPHLFHHYLDMMSSMEMDELEKLVTLTEANDNEAVDDEHATTVIAIHTAVGLYQHTSSFFSRNLRAAVKEHPECLARLNDDEFMREIAQGVVAEVNEAHSLSRRRQLLIDYFRIEYLRVGVLLLSGAPLLEVHRQYTEFSDVFFTMLYRLARREVQKKTERQVEIRDHAAMFATGGRGREEAFDDDLDLLVISEDLSDDGLAFMRKIIGKMNQWMVRLAIFPHYRMADHFGDMVTPINVIQKHFGSDSPGLFVDMTELMEIRLLVGNPHFESHIRRVLIHDILYGDRRDYLMSALAAEIRDRRRHYAAEASSGTNSVNIKEHPGGLREIELALIHRKIHYGLAATFNLELFDRLAPLHGTDGFLLSSLKDHFIFLKKLRHLIRVLVAADDVLNPETAAKLTAFSAAAGSGLWQEMEERMADARKIISRLITA